jgi:hypothetical protein
MQKNYEALEEKPAEEKPLEAAPPPGDRSEAPAKGSLAEQLGITNPNQKIELYGPDGQTKVTTFGEADALLNQGYTLGPATKAPPIPTSVPLKEPGATLAKPPIDVFDTTAEEAAIKERANIEASKAAGEMEIQDKYIKQRETMHDKYFNPETGILTKRNEAADKLFDAAMTGRVDPDAYWRTNPNDPNSDIDTGKKIRAGIGMLISGIGAGLGRTTNLAVAQINNAIDRNIDAQKYNIGQKWNAFKMYGEQTNNVISQMNLMKADMLDVSAAMTLKNAAQFAGPAAMQQAVIASQELRRQASVQRQEATLRDVHLESGILDLDMKRAQHSWMTEMYGGPQTANGTSTTMNDPARRARLIGQGVALGMIKPETLVYDQQDVPITDQNGKVMTDKDGRPQMKTQVVPYVAPDHERAQKADQILEGTRRVISAVNELEQITDRSHLGVWDRTKLGRAQELMLEIATSLERVQAGGGLNRMPSPEIMKAIHDAMGDPTSINTGRTFGALDEIRKRMIEEQRTTRGTLK